MSEASDDDTQVMETLDPSQLPKSHGFLRSHTILKYQGSWYLSDIIPNITAFQQKFRAQNQDIILASNPKSGTTWLKALLFSIINRARYTNSDTPLLTTNPQELVPFLELDIFSKNPAHDLAVMSPPRLFATHVCYSSLPESVVKHSECRLIYICRNPLDFITSFYHFAKKIYATSDEELISIEDYVEQFCKGEHYYGPFWDHVIGFWKASLENPHKVLFLKYEDMLEDTVLHTKRIADFVEFPFSEEEINKGVVDEIVGLCSLSSLKELQVNKHGNYVTLAFENNVFFRKGQVGDWKNLLTPSMSERVKKAVEEKLHGSGLTFTYD